VEAEFFHADRQTHMTKLTDALRNFANAPKKLSLFVLQGSNRCFLLHPKDIKTMHNFKFLLLKVVVIKVTTVP